MLTSQNEIQRKHESCCRPLHLTGLVTESMRGREESVLAPWDFGNKYSGRDFVSYSELMDDLGVPKTTYECSKTRLKNGKVVFFTDPRLGWGANGFGYYLMTFIEPTEDR